MIGESFFANFARNLFKVVFCQMDDIERLKRQIYEADTDRLREIVIGWIEESDDFMKFAVGKLNPAPENIDFDRELSRAIELEALASASSAGSVNWGNIYRCKIQPWADNADELSTSDLLRLCVAIIERVAFSLTKDDFHGDDWNNDEHSMNIALIMDTLGNIVGNLLMRKDLTENNLLMMKELMKTASGRDVTPGFVSSPYAMIAELIEARETAGEATIGMYDIMMYANLDNKGGEWLCRKIDFCQSIGLMEEAWKLVDDNIKYPHVAAKLCITLMNEDRWKEALELIDRVIEMGSDTEVRTYRFGASYDWLGMRQQILREYGSVEDRLENLKQLFLNATDDYGRYYSELKELVPPESWKAVYTALLSDVKGYGAIDKVAPFLEKEGEYDWLVRLLQENEQSDSTDYRRPLRYAVSLLSHRDAEIKELLLRTFRAYACSRFLPKQKVRPSKYRNFCADIRKLSELGAADVMKELIVGFKSTYGTRPSLMAELRKIKSC